ncbi:ABC-2 transporter permease [Camelliibacillus cellulosilyticus]|uniref:ABC-2 transporter permease n=1 Tax=Camelliibacillus cellulosilyticus TaxID=2174486 RepID=A0ABV9GT23_9BACL
MGALFRREWEIMYPSSWRLLKVYFFIGVGYLLIAWLIGPSGFGLVKIDTINLFISLMGMMFTNFRMTENLEQDRANRQMTFLQTLPVAKNKIVHAKFLSVLSLCAMNIIWIVLLVAGNLTINHGWSWGAWGVVQLFSSMMLFISGMLLLSFFVWGRGHMGWLFYLSLAIWGGILFLLAVIIGLAIDRLWLFSLIGSIVTYLICWGVSWFKVARKGFPVEAGVVDVNINHSDDRLVGDDA